MLMDVKLNDVVRFFHGDGPACESEAGQQKKGGIHVGSIQQTLIWVMI